MTFRRVEEVSALEAAGLREIDRGAQRTYWFYEHNCGYTFRVVDKPLNVAMFRCPQCTEPAPF